jgi:hypothetical protein
VHTKQETARPVEALKRLRGRPWHVILPVAVYLILTLAGVTQSSIGRPDLREDPADPTGVMLGEALAIRSDEFLTATPIQIGVTATGGHEDLNPLSAPQEFFSQLPAGPVSSVILFDGAALQLGPLLPDSMLLAARWWLPFLLIALAMPAWFRILTGSRWIGYFAAALAVFSPSSAWWSFSPVQILGFAFAGSTALLKAVEANAEGRKLPMWAWGVTSALLLARTPVFYQPWAIVITTTIVLTTVAAILGRRGRRRSSTAIVALTGFATLGAFGLVLRENWAAIQTVSNTIYPGERVATGAPNPLQELFAATSLGQLKDAPEVAGSNWSEISSSFAVCAVLAVMLIARGVNYRGRSHRYATYALAALTAFWLAWTTVDFGSIGASVPVLNLVPPARVADIFGYLAIALLCLVLPRIPDRNAVGFAVLAAGVVWLVAAHAGSLLRVANLPADLSIRYVWASAFALALVVFLVVLRPRLPYGYVLGAGLALLMVWNVNPLLVGLADLRGSQVARQMMAAGDAARRDHTVWASDTYTVDSLMIATGVPALSGRQLSGPDVEAWSKIDPDRSDEAIWNRGASFIWFEWTDSRDLTLSNPNADIVKISGSPCEVAERLPRLSTIVATRELDLDCLTPSGDFDWAGSPRFIYDIER